MQTLVTLLLGSYAFVSHASPTLSSTKWLHPRDPCTPVANGYEAIDDSPAINDAIKACGKGGTIIIPEGQFYSIRTPIDFSPCNHCEFQIEGTLLSARGQWSYWRGVDSTFTIANVTGLRIRSVTGNGLVDGNAIEYYTTRFDSGVFPMPSHFHVTNGSSDIVIENLRMKDVMHRFVRSEGHSHGVTIRNLNLTMEKQWGYYPRSQNDAAGIELGQTTDITISNISLNITTLKDPSVFRYQDGGGTVGTCLAIDRFVHNVTATGLSCTNTYAGAVISFDSIGNLPKPTDEETADLVSNIHISDSTFDGYVNTGALSYPYQNEHITNVTWSNITILSGRWGSVSWCWLRSHSITSFPPTCAANEVVHVQGMEWSNFRGKVGNMPNGSNWSDFAGGVNAASTQDYRFSGYWINT